MFLTGKTAAVLGASGDIGRAIALRLAELGADLSLTGRTAEKLSAVAEDIRGKTGRVVKSFQHDLRGSGESTAFVKETIDAFGRLDVLVTCAGDFKRGEVCDISQDDWKSGFELMFVGAATAVAAGWPHLKQQGGHIIMISGLHGLEPHAESIVSGPICAAILNFAKGASHSATRDGISLNCIVPGWIEGRRLSTRLDKVENTSREEAQENFRKQLELRRFGRPEDVANVVELLVSDKGSYIQGASIVLDGGMTHAI